MRRLLFGLMGCLYLFGRAQGQVPPYNPYAPAMDDPSPVKADGTINWPPFFKDKALEDRFQSYFAMGSCVGTKKAITEMLRVNKVDVNKLPESEVKGLAGACDTAVLTVADPAGQPAVIMTHPAGVTKVSVSGPMPVSELKPNMVVRFLGRVDARGVGTDPIEAIEVVTPGPTFRWLPVQAGRVQTVTGVVTKLAGQKLQVRVDTGKLHRLTFPVSNKATVSVDGNSLSLISAGDQVAAKGRTYSAAGPGGAQVVFASEVTVTKGSAPPKVKSTDAEVVAKAD